MAVDLSEALAPAALNETERRVVERIVSALQALLGEDLLAVWLYGSRARGEADPTETDPDRRSDVDMLAVVDAARDAASVSWDVLPLVEEIADAEGDSPVYYSVQVRDADWLADRREIRSFFVQEVDRDKIVRAGGDLEKGKDE
jgi:predicted nucleotidyltransferase